MAAEQAPGELPGALSQAVVHAATYLPTSTTPRT